jgi:hypothetical protein
MDSGRDTWYTIDVERPLERLLRNFWREIEYLKGILYYTWTGCAVLGKDDMKTGHGTLKH